MLESPPTILIVDDREENRYISSRILRSAGYTVVEATNGREALEKVLLNPALVILDIRLPDMVGYEVCRRIKANPQTANIPVLQISAVFTSSESRVQALESGVDAYLTQPIEPTVLIATVRALLRLREAEALSRRSAKQWQSTFDALSEGVSLLDNDWKVVRCNRAMTQLLKKAYGEIEKRDVRALLRKTLDLELSEQAPARIERETRHGRRWFSVRTDLIQDQDSVRGAILILTEITDRKLAEEALRFTERLAAMGRLANSIAHEINNPLEAITNLLYLLKIGQHDAETTEYIEMASAELERVSRITKQTLAFNRESNQPVEVSIAEILDGVVTLYTPQFNQKGIRVVLRYEPSAPVAGFPGELRQVFSNLLRNAMEATPVDGQLTVHVYPSVDWKDLARTGVRISILDSGMGIPEDVRPHIFEPFFTTKQLKGSGLGLWLSLGIVTRHQGRMKVRSNTAADRHGTCFSVFLPERPRQDKRELASVSVEDRVGHSLDRERTSVQKSA
jgi:two-component system, NtrC family, sensor kinase